MSQQPEKAKPKNVTVPLAPTDVEALRRRPTGIRASTYVVSLLRSKPHFQATEDSDGVVLDHEAVENLYIHMPADLVEHLEARSEEVGYAPYLRSLIRYVAKETPQPDVLDGAPEDLQTVRPRQPRQRVSLDPEPPPPPPPARPPVLPPGVDPEGFWFGDQPDLRWVMHPVRISVDARDITSSEHATFGSTSDRLSLPWVGPGEHYLLVVGLDADDRPTCADSRQLDALLGVAMLGIYARVRRDRHRVVTHWRRETCAMHGTRWHVAEVEVHRLK